MAALRNFKKHLGYKPRLTVPYASNAEKVRIEIPFDSESDIDLVVEKIENTFK